MPIYMYTLHIVVYILASEAANQVHALSDLPG